MYFKPRSPTFTNNGKKGASQIDWLVSLVIFLIFIGWFFIFARPVFFFSPGINTAESAAGLIIGEYSSNTEYVPLFAVSNYNASEQPMIFEINSVNAKTDYMSSNSFGVSMEDGSAAVVDLSKIFLVNDIVHGNNVFYASIYNETPVYDEISDFYVSASTVSNGKLSVYFNDSIMQSVYHASQVSSRLRLSLFKYYINGYLLNPSNYTYDKKYFISKHLFEYSGNYHETYVFDDFPAIYNFVELNDAAEFSIRFNAHDYTKFFINAFDSGNIVDGCNTYQGNMLDLHDTKGVFIELPDSPDADITICKAAGDISVRIKYNQIKSMSYNVVFHDGDYLALYHDINGFELPETNSGYGKQADVMNYDLIVNDNRTYSELKADLGISEDFSFAITLENGTEFIYSKVLPGNRDTVYALESSCGILVGNLLQDCELRVNLW